MQCLRTKGIARDGITQGLGAAIKPLRRGVPSPRHPQPFESQCSCCSGLGQQRIRPHGSGRARYATGRPVNLARIGLFLPSRAGYGLVTTGPPAERRPILARKEGPLQLQAGPNLIQSRARSGWNRFRSGPEKSGPGSLPAVPEPSPWQGGPTPSTSEPAGSLAPGLCRRRCRQ